MTRSAARPVVFLGPTTPVEEAAQTLPATYLPPAAQGSFITAISKHGPSAILLIDGIFQGEPAVRHKEILWAISRGVPVFGAASMGALRAAELWRQGMVGVGLIYRWYRRFALLPDDAVAVLHGPTELGSRALSLSLIDLRRTLRKAERAGHFDRTLRKALEGAATTLNFRDRTLANVIDRTLEHRGDDGARSAMQSVLTRNFVAQKKADALQALRLLARLDKNGMLTPRPTCDFAMTNAFRHDLSEAGIDAG